jgi:hypothetical protein
VLDSTTVRRALAGMIAVAIVGWLALGATTGRVNADANPAPTVFRSFLPGISADSATMATPGTALSPLVTIQNVSTWAPGGLWVYGEVHNGLSTTVTGVTVTATASDIARNVVASRTALASVDQIGAGKNGPFRILLAGANQPGLQVTTVIANYTVAAWPAVTDQVTISSSGPRPLEIHTPDPTHHVDVVTTSTDLAAIDGTITNNSSQPIASPQVFVAVYDGAGRVAMLSTTGAVTMPYQGTGPAVLNPGQTGTFTVLVAIPDFYQVQGSTKLVGFLGPAPATQ